MKTYSLVMCCAITLVASVSFGQSSPAPGVCAGTQVCGTFTPDCNACNPQVQPCYCFNTDAVGFIGNGVCTNDYSCAGPGRRECASSAECDSGNVCMFSTCCNPGGGWCAPANTCDGTIGGAKELGSGLTATGKMLK